MGSYLSIVNGTPNEWQCRIGADEKALKVAGIVVSVLGSIAAVVGAAGAALPMVATVTAGGSTMTIAGIATTAVSGAATFGVFLARSIAEALDEQGCVRINPGKKHRWGRMSLSLWQQGTCSRSYALNPYTVRTETICMRPIFSGCTHNSERVYDIQDWIDEHGVLTHDTVAVMPGDPTNENVTRRLMNTTEGHHQVLEYYPGVTDISDWTLEEGDTVIIYPSVEKDMTTA